jgi:hypothetical protein
LGDPTRLQLLAQGRLILKALESIRVAGLGADGLPKLAITRAHRERCWVRPHSNGSAAFEDYEWGRASNSLDRIEFPPRSFQFRNAPYKASSVVPTVPLHLRPKRGLQNHHILFEAIWKPEPTRDPYLLRRIGKADMWLVVAMWELSEVERAALATRITTA